MKIDFTFEEMVAFLKSRGYSVYKKEVEYSTDVYHNRVEWLTKEIFVTKSPSGIVPKFSEYTDEKEIVNETFSKVLKGALLESLSL